MSPARLHPHKHEPFLLTAIDFARTTIESVSIYLKTGRCLPTIPISANLRVPGRNKTVSLSRCYCCGSCSATCFDRCSHGYHICIDKPKHVHDAHAALGENVQVPTGKPSVRARKDFQLNQIREPHSIPFQSDGWSLQATNEFLTAKFVTALNPSVFVHHMLALTIHCPPRGVHWRLKTADYSTHLRTNSLHMSRLAMVRCFCNRAQSCEV